MPKTATKQYRSQPHPNPFIEAEQVGREEAEFLNERLKRPTEGTQWDRRFL
jgi:hypothetical protein